MEISFLFRKGKSGLKKQVLIDSKANFRKHTFHKHKAGFVKQLVWVNAKRAFVKQVLCECEAGFD